MGSGPIGANCYRSKLHLTWVARAVSNYGSLGKSEVGTVSDGASGGTASGGTSYHPSDRSGRCYYASSDGRGRRGFGGPLYEVRKTKVFSPLKHERICCACGLYPANNDAGRIQSTLCSLPRGDWWSKWRHCCRIFWPQRPMIGTHQCLDVARTRARHEGSEIWLGEQKHPSFMSPGNFAFHSLPGVDGSAKKASQDSRSGRPRDLFIYRWRQGAGSRAGLLPCVLPRNVKLVGEVHMPPHGALWSRLLPSD